ncbi:MAG: ECF transporter S component [Oscillospiraceae bacterium]|nr:ECF transporter S component [Oscillospiraceae bacterium]
MEHPIRKIVMAALFAALCCAATMVIQIPSPMQGYVNLGDCVVLLSGWMLGPWYGLAAAGIGSAMADVLLSYAHYAPGTLVIKGLMALVCGLLAARRTEGGFVRRVISGAAAEVLMVAGYFGYACLLLGKGLAAAASIPGNLFQGAVGVTAAVVLYGMLEKSGSLRYFRKVGLHS